MKRYKDLNLRKIMEDAQIDFAHYTFFPGQCSCCFGPSDMPEEFWRNRTKKQSNEDYTFILFNNADNGSGVVSANSYIKDGTCILWELSDTQLKQVCMSLQEQLRSGYTVIEPESDKVCIKIDVIPKLHVE